MPKLLSEQNTPKVEKLIRTAAAARFGRGKAKSFFEHDHWWVTVENEEGDDQYFDVVDSSPSIANTGLDFEPV